MSKGAYTYEPGNITEFGKDRMRFELGDTMVEGLADTTALTDEEIQAAIDAYPNKWKRAKLMLLEVCAVVLRMRSTQRPVLSAWI